MHTEIIPSLLVDGKEAFERRLRLVENHVKTVAVDILDGSTYQVTNWFNAEAISAMHTPVQFILHLMVENPLEYIYRVKGSKKIKKIFFHYEVDDNF